MTALMMIYHKKWKVDYDSDDSDDSDNESDYLPVPEMPPLVRKVIMMTLAIQSW